MRRATLGVMTACRVWLLLLSAALAVGAAQSTVPLVEIGSPESDSYLTGPVLLRANIAPPAAVSNVIFFVDGRVACAVDAPPFECEWDAGSNVIERQVRLMAMLAGGGRIYLLGYQPSDSTRDGRWHDISIRVDGHRNVRARQGYRFTPVRP